MNNNTKAVELVRKLFVDAYDASCLHEVWQLVGAIRGPDNNNPDAKDMYTSPIRAALITSHMARYLCVSQHMNYSENYSVPKMTLYTQPFQDDHFHGHIRMAQHVLNNSEVHNEVSSCPCGDDSCQPK